MPISLTLPLLGSAAKPHALDPESVLFTFHTQEDERVRPSHEALDGTTWKVGDPRAPVPPIDYGCRCFITYNAVEDSAADGHLPPTDTRPVLVGRAFADFLDDNLKGWKAIADAIKGRTPADRLAMAVLLVQKAKPSLSMADARDYARMITQAD